MIGHYATLANTNGENDITIETRPGRIAMHHQDDGGVAWTFVQEVHTDTVDIKPVRLEWVERFRRVEHVVPAVQWSVLI
jgi:hypothetical protein